jgi:hypothetical protein
MTREINFLGDKRTILLQDVAQPDGYGPCGLLALANAVSVEHPSWASVHASAPRQNSHVLTRNHHPQASLRKLLKLSTLTDAQGMVDHDALVGTVVSLVWGGDGTTSDFTRKCAITDMLRKLEDSDGAGTEIDLLMGDVTFSSEIAEFNSLLEKLDIKGFHACKLDLEAMEPSEKGQWEVWLEGGKTSYMELANILAELFDAQSEGTSPTSEVPTWVNTRHSPKSVCI